QRRPRAHRRHRLRRRLDAAHRRRPDDPGRRRPPAPARQRGSPRRRHPGPARPRHHPGLHRHPDPVQPAALLPLRPHRPEGPSALNDHETLSAYIDAETSATSYWSNLPAFMVSLLKAWFGDDATPANEFAYGYLPMMVGDHSHIPMFIEMAKGNIEGFFVMGQNPAVGGQNASSQRQALAKLKWMVVRDLYETETATFWTDSPEVKNGTLKPEEIPTEVFFLPAAAVAEGSGSFTNTQRLVQWHEKAVDPPG